MGIFLSIKMAGIISGPYLSSNHKLISPVPTPKKMVIKLRLKRKIVVTESICFFDAPKIQKLVKSLFILLKKIKSPDVIHSETKKDMATKRKIITEDSNCKAQTNALFSRSHDLIDSICWPNFFCKSFSNFNKSFAQTILTLLMAGSFTKFCTKGKRTQTLNSSASGTEVSIILSTKVELTRGMSPKKESTCAGETN